MLAESIPQKLEVNKNNIDLLSNPSFELQQGSSPDKTILPKTNLTVSSYRGTTPENTFNAIVMSLNRSHWFVHCDYSYLTLDDLSFDTIVDRTGINHSYEASNYWDWQEGKQVKDFEFWIDPTEFYDGFYFEEDSVTATVTSDTIRMLEINQEFDAWKITINVGIIISVWYAVDNGLFLCMKQDWIASLIWYNLTRAEIAQPPQDYTGPYLGQISHSNNSRLASNTLITIELTSPYGSDIIYYHWDDNINSTAYTSLISVNLPDENDSHDLIIIAFDNVGYQSVYHLIYTTDNTLPGISLINQRNNSKIKGSAHIQLQISSGNGTIFYRWDGGSNETIDEGTDIPVPNPEIETLHTLEVYVRGITGLWAYSSYSWTVDNSPPQLSFVFVNNSIIKGDVNIVVFSTEDINLTYRLIGLGNRSTLLYTGENHTISYSNLENGSYQLFIIASDEADNIASTSLVFSIYTSAFNWNWELEADTPRTIKIINATSDLWFILTITSAIDQSFNLSVLSEDSHPSQNDMIDYVIEFSCENPDDIFFISLTLQLKTNTSELPVYQWVHWDVESGEWVNITTSYNEVSNSWEATFNGFVPYFALINPGIKTTLTSITPGGGQIPSFEIVPTILSLLLMTILGYRRSRKNKKYPGLK